MTAADLKPSTGTNLTVAQTKELKTLQEKEKVTEKQEQKMQELIEKRDKKPELSQTAKTYLKSWLKEQKPFYNRRKDIKSKYLTKGNFCEDPAIDFLNSVLLEDYSKNTERKSDKWMTGECDIDAGHLIRDIKNSWEPDTFPLFEEFCNTDYYWQGLGYMNLWGAQSYAVDYLLMDAPIHLIEREAKIESYNSIRPYEQIFDEFYEKMTFGDIDPKLRVKSFYFKRDDEKIQKIKDRVEMCQLYVNELVSKVFS